MRRSAIVGAIVLLTLCLPAPAGAKTIVRVGFYAATIQGLDQQDSSYYVDGFVWMRWRGDADPSATFEFTNNIERWGLTQTAVYEKPKQLANGERVQQFRVQGRYFRSLDLSDYPLDRQTLSVVIEDTTSAEDELVYVADERQSGLDRAARIPGWRVTGHGMSIGHHTYSTDFGEPGTSRAARTYSAARFDVSIERPRTFFLWKLMLPLLIVMILAGSVLFIHPTLTEVRLAAPATALLSLVFLQQSYSSTLPEIGSLVLLDKIYALAYALVIVLMLTIIVTSYWVRGDMEANAGRAARLDRRVALGAAVVFALGTVLFVTASV